MGSFNKLKKLLEEKESFLLVCHVDPDGDAIGSMLGLGEALKNSGKEVTLFCGDTIPVIFSYLDEVNLIKDKLSETSFGAVILLDNGDMRRTGIADKLKEMKKNKIPVINIDHHPKNDIWKFVDINYAHPESSSTSELIYDLLIGFHYEITSKIATALLTGIFYDTGGFRHPNTSQRVLAITSELLKKGAKLKKISENIANFKTVSVFKLWGIALNRLRVNSYGISVSVLTKEDLEICGATEEDVTGLTNLLSSAPESKAALLIYETEDAKIKGSLRSDRDDIDLSKLAQMLGGGGHKKASGFSLNGKLVTDGDEWKVI